MTRSERPMLYQGAMVRTILRDVEPKTQTRRLVKDQAGLLPCPPTLRPSLDARQMLTAFWGVHARPCPYGRPGDRLWVKETFYAFGRWETRYSAKKGRDEWHFIDMTVECGHAYHYDVNDPVKIVGAKGRSSITPMWWKRPAIFMPRQASRILLEVTEVRVQRLQDISEADALAEGVYSVQCNDLGTEVPYYRSLHEPRDLYRMLWDSINGKTPGAAWADNPWVWVVSFKRVTP